MSFAIAHPNIAFIKYWGNQDQALRIPRNGSISMNLANLETRTAVSLRDNIESDQLWINGISQFGPALERVSSFLNVLRKWSGKNTHAEIRSYSNFPSSAGIASSAAAFAALALAGAHAFGLQLEEKELSCLARRGSGSASRSVPAGFTEWQAGTNDQDSYAYSIAPADSWALWDCIAVVESGPKPTGSTAGHALASTSPLQAARVADAPRRLDICRKAVLERDFDKLADVIELDSNLMHAVMMTSHPMLMYWTPTSLQVMKEVQGMRRSGLAAAFTLDAGPNVHVITTEGHHSTVEKQLSAIPAVKQVICSPVGGAAHMVAGEINNL